MSNYAILYAIYVHKQRLLPKQKQLPSQMRGELGQEMLLQGMMQSPVHGRLPGERVLKQENQMILQNQNHLLK